MRKIATLKPEEVLRLAISVEDRNEKVYKEYATIFEDEHPEASGIFAQMAGEEREHGQMLRTFYAKKFGHPPTQDFLEEIAEPVEAPMLPDSEVFIYRDMSPDHAFDVAKKTEILAQNFYDDLSKTTKDPELQKLYTELAEIEKGHKEEAERLEKEHAAKRGKK